MFQVLHHSVRGGKDDVHLSLEVHVGRVGNVSKESLHEFFQQVPAVGSYCAGAVLHLEKLT